MERRKKSKPSYFALLGAILGIVSLLVSVGLVVFLIWVSIHFITKFW